jgi:hypothetical protein
MTASSTPASVIMSGTPQPSGISFTVDQAIGKELDGCSISLIVSGVEVDGVDMYGRIAADSLRRELKCRALDLECCSDELAFFPGSWVVVPGPGLCQYGSIIELY